MNFEDYDAELSEDLGRYARACHAMQSGVAYEQQLGSEDGTSKHLRVGINSTQVNQAAIVTLLIEKGIITMAEYIKAVADEMECEVARYETRLPEGVRLA